MEEPFVPLSLTGETATPSKSTETQPMPSPALVPEPLTSDNCNDAGTAPDYVPLCQPIAEVDSAFSDAWKSLGFRKAETSQEQSNTNNIPPPTIGDRPWRQLNRPPPSIPPTTRPGLRSEGQEGWRPFNATAIVRGNRYDLDPPVTEARRAEAHVSTPDNIEINIFCDGSFGSDSTKKGVGGCAIVFKKSRPGQVDDQQEVIMAWKMDTAISSGFAEDLALAQALVQARHEVVATVKSFFGSSNDAPVESSQNSLQQLVHPSAERPTAQILDLGSKSIVVNIFSDSMSSLDPLPIRFHMKSDDLKLKIARLLYDAVDELISLQVPEIGSQLSVKVQLLWLPSHRPGSEVRFHVLADRAAAEARQRGSFAQVGSGQPQAIEDGLYAALHEHFVTSDMAEIYGRKKTKRKREDDEDEVVPRTKRPRQILYNESDELRPKKLGYGTKRRFANSSNPWGDDRKPAMSIDERPKKIPRRIAPTLISAGNTVLSLEERLKKIQRRIEPTLIKSLEEGLPQTRNPMEWGHLDSVYEEFLGDINSMVKSFQDGLTDAQSRLRCTLGEKANAAGQAPAEPAPRNAHQDQGEKLPLFFDLGRTPIADESSFYRGRDQLLHLRQPAEGSENAAPSNANQGQGEKLPFFFDLGRASIAEPAPVTEPAPITEAASVTETAPVTEPAPVTESDTCFYYGADRVLRWGQPPEAGLRRYGEPPKEKPQPLSFALGYNAGSAQLDSQGSIREGGSRRRRHIVRKTSSERVSGPTTAEEIARLSLQQKAHDFFHSGKMNQWTTADSSTQTMADDARASGIASYKDTGSAAVEPFVFRAGSTVGDPTEELPDNIHLTVQRPRPNLRQIAWPRGWKVGKPSRPAHSAESRMSSPANSAERMKALPILVKSSGAVDTFEGVDRAKPAEDMVGKHPLEEYSHFLMSSYR